MFLQEFLRKPSARTKTPLNPTTNPLNLRLRSIAGNGLASYWVIFFHKNTFTTLVRSRSAVFNHVMRSGRRCMLLSSRTTRHEIARRTMHSRVAQTRNSSKINLRSQLQRRERNEFEQNETTNKGINTHVFGSCIAMNLFVILENTLKR